jgi:glutamine cyclotransferase
LELTAEFEGIREGSKFYKERFGPINIEAVIDSCKPNPTVFSLFYPFSSQALTAGLHSATYFCLKSRELMKKLPLLLLFIAFACKNKDNNDPVTPGPNAPKTMNFSIIRTYPHDTSFYTQGLLIYNGELYEGTGLDNGRSRLMKVDLNTGKAIQSITLDKEIFGEGVVILRDTVYQLTWQNKKVLVYTLKDFKKIKEYKNEHEGWGLTTDGKQLIASDGSSTLYYYDPSSFKLLKTQDVTESGSLSYNLNELEYIDGFIYANQYQAPYIFKIDPNNGSIVGKADLTSVWDRIKNIDPDADVPNGIAYDQVTKKIYVTGKLWPELYEIQFSN